MSSDKILPLLESLLFGIDQSGEISPVGTAAERFLKQLGITKPTPALLFGVSEFADLIAAAQSGHALTADVPGAAGTRFAIKWQFAIPKQADKKQPTSILATGINWLPTGELLSALTRENLLYKEMLLNLIPSFIVEKLLQQKVVQPKAYRDCSVMFADVVSFSKIAFHLDPVSLLRRLDQYFSAMDRAARPFLIEKIKTIGDAYMAVSGIPNRRPSHAVDAALSVLHMLAALKRLTTTPQMVGSLDVTNWNFRFGMHSGPCIAGVLGSSRYLFDLWGDTVNIAARMESVGQGNVLTVSEAAQKHLAPFFQLRYVGEKSVKNIGEVKVYLVDRLLPEYSADADGLVPNAAFLTRYVTEFFDGPGKPARSTMPPFFQSLLSAA
ncbi:MAG TPA: adenylate/guanylate cyclase domain-containing protein [Pseudomonadota bacterium]|nr:adenylate/guanylate cyclase domain-containing protein [Pseudomonadota bacterium]